MWLHYRSIFTQYSQEYVYGVTVLMHSIECNYEAIKCYGNLCGKIPEYNLQVNTKRIVARQIQSLPLKQNGKHHKCVYEQKLKRVPTYFISFNHFNGTELTVIYFVNIPFSMQKGRFLSLNPLLNAGGVISV